MVFRMDSPPYCTADDTVDRSFSLSSIALTMDCALYCSVEGFRLLILPFVHGLYDGLHAVLLSGWQRIAHSFSCQLLSQRFSRRITQLIAVHCSFFHSWTAFTTVYALYCSANDSELFILSLLDGVPNDLCAILFRGWQRITLSSTRQWRSWFTYHCAKRMAPRSLFFHSSTGVTSVCAPYCSQADSPSLVLALLKGFSDNSHPLLLGWQRIPCSSACQWLS